MESLTLHHGPLRFSASTLGSGPLVMCLHGFPDNRASWREQLPALANAGYRAVAVQIRGYEPRSQPKGGDYSLAAIAKDVLAFLDELQSERAHLIGHDWGAAIAYVAGAAAPERFRSLVTMAVPHSGRFLTQTPRHARQLRLSWYMLYFQLRGLADWHLRRNDYAFIRQLWRDWSPGWEPAEETLDNVIESFRQPGVGSAALAYYRAALAIRSMPLGSAAREAAQFKVPVPTLALTGAEDGCIDSHVFQRMMYAEDFPSGMKVTRISGAGHFLHREQPELVNAAIIDWLQQHDQ